MLEGFDTSATIIAADIDQAFMLNFWVSIVLFCSVVLPMLFFAWKYRASNVKNENIENYTHNTLLEILWTVIPTSMLMVMFYYGYTSMKTARTMPADENSIVIELVGKKWSWNFTYPNGKSTSELFVPKSTNVILNMSAPLNDVIHSFFVPAFRMKEDVVPGRTTRQWFNSDNIGVYDVECAEYCGTAHAKMLSKVHVISQADYNAWMNEDGAKANWATPIREELNGAEIFAVNCASCHTLDGKPSVGPSLMGVGKRDVAYIKESMMNPDAVYAKGFEAGGMPAFDYLDPKDIEKLASYLKEQK